MPVLGPPSAGLGGQLLERRPVQPKTDAQRHVVRQEDPQAQGEGAHQAHLEEAAPGMCWSKKNRIGSAMDLRLNLGRPAGEQLGHGRLVLAELVLDLRVAGVSTSEGAPYYWPQGDS
jgi:hypothetical protein